MKLIPWVITITVTLLAVYHSILSQQRLDLANCLVRNTIYHFDNVTPKSCFRILKKTNHSLIGCFQDK